MKCLLGQGGSIDIDALPYGPDDEQSPAGIETVVLAEPVGTARGRILEEVPIKREAGEKPRTVVNLIGDEEDIVEIKAEPEA